MRIEGARDNTVSNNNSCNVTAISSGSSEVPRLTPILGKGTD
jgi:hypothetical protein